MRTNTKKKKRKNDHERSKRARLSNFELLFPVNMRRRGGDDGCREA